MNEEVAGVEQGEIAAVAAVGVLGAAIGAWLVRRELCSHRRAAQTALRMAWANKARADAAEAAVRRLSDRLVTLGVTSAEVEILVAQDRHFDKLVGGDR